MAGPFNSALAKDLTDLFGTTEEVGRSSICTLGFSDSKPRLDHCLAQLARVAEASPSQRGHFWRPCAALGSSRQPNNVMQLNGNPNKYAHVAICRLRRGVPFWRESFTFAGNTLETDPHG